MSESRSPRTEADRTVRAILDDAEWFAPPGAYKGTMPVEWDRAVRATAKRIVDALEAAAPRHGAWCVQDGKGDNAGPFVHDESCHDGRGETSDTEQTAAPRSGEGLDADIDPTPIIEIVEDVLQEHGYKAGPRMTNTANDMGARLADRLRR